MSSRPSPNQATDSPVGMLLGCCGVPAAIVVVIVGYLALTPHATHKSAFPFSPAPPSISAVSSPGAALSGVRPPDAAERRRHDIWNDYCKVQAGIKAALQREFDPARPATNANDPAYLKWIEKRTAREEQLHKAGETQILKRWKISEDALTHVCSEAQDKAWAAPDGPHADQFPE